ncbi:MAG: hypothetical protein FWE13_05030 [Firmicutes bacterium]|nr:hypothetical protein [Bacillota bacterium]
MQEVSSGFLRKNLQFEKNECSKATPMNSRNADFNQKDAESYAKPTGENLFNEDYECFTEIIIHIQLILTARGA